MTTSWSLPLPVGVGQSHDLDAGLGVVAVHMEDRHVVAAGHVGAIPTGEQVLGVGGEAGLVVDDGVDRPTDGAVAVGGEVHGFLHDALAEERCIAVDRPPGCIVAD